jgi:DNA invertase Pin-like site-specific DNA recombinase
MIAGVYARKSTDDSDKAADSKSVTRQVERAQEYAAKMGWSFNDEFVYIDDNVSGATFKRPALTRLLEMVTGKKHKLDVLIVSEQSRLGRDTFRTIALIQTLTDTGVKIWSYLDAKEISLDDEMGEAEQFLKAWAGSSERRKTSQRVRDQQRRRAEQGKPTGSRILGYALVDGIRTVNPGEAKLVRRIFRRRSEGAGYFRIAGELKKDGIRSPRDSRNKKTGAILWSPTTIADITRNEIYRGWVVYGKTKQTWRRGAHFTVKTPDDIIRRKNESLRIIPEDVWTAVQKVNTAASANTWRGKDGRLKSRPTQSKHLVTAFIACGHCGGSMHIRYQGTAPRREYLFCTRRHLNGKEACSNARRLPVPHAEKALMHAFEEALVGSIVMDKLKTAVAAHHEAAQDPAPLQAEAKKLKTEVNRLVESLATGKSTSVTGAIEQREQRMKEIEESLAGLTTMQDLDIKAFGDDVMATVADWKEHLKRNHVVAQQVLRKILPQKLKATPNLKEGGWMLEGDCDYRAVLAEVGLEAVSAALSKLSSRSCPSPCSVRPSVRGTPRSRRTPPR